MRKLVKVSAMLAIAAIMQIGGCKLAYAERGYKAIGSERLIFPVVLFLEYKAFCEPGESFYEDEERSTMLDITAETKKVREDMEKQGYVLTEEEYQIILEYTIRKSDRCGKGRDYVPLLLEDEIKNYYFRNTVTAISLINMAVA